MLKEAAVNGTLQFNGKIGGTLELNLTDRHRLVGGATDIGPHLREALRVVESQGKRRTVTQAALDAADVIINSEVIIAPQYIFGSGLNLKREIAQHFVENDDFASELHRTLVAVGALDFLSRVGDPLHSEGIIMRILSVFALSGCGQGSIANVPTEYMHGVVSWFRTPDDVRWREDIDRLPIVNQCLKAVVTGLAEITGDQSLIARSGNLRDYAGRMGPWKEFRRSTDPLKSELTTRLDAFLDSSSASPSDTETATARLGDWLAEAYPGKSLREVCLSQESRRGFPKFLEDRLKLNPRSVIDTSSAAKRLTDFFLTQLESEFPHEHFFPLISEAELTTARNAEPRPAKKSSTSSNPLPEKLFALAKSILDEGEKGWPGRNTRFYETVVTGDTIYCPVIPTLLRCALDVPLRVVQWRRSDSGEGDVRRFNGHTMQWDTNDGPWAGYWADKDNKRHQGYPGRGYAVEFKDDVKKITGIHVNTNKTGNPYNIPWQHEAVHRRLWELRLWQEKYNPITGPIPPERYLENPRETPTATKRRLPQIFPLFRLFPTSSKNFLGRIVTTSELSHAWNALLAEIQRVWNLENPANPIQIVEFHPKTGEARKPTYNPHGMRVRGLTDLYRGGMPVEILSKVVAGHATVRMTVFYLDLDPIDIDELLSAAAAEARSTEAQELMDSFTRLDLAEAQRRAVSLDPAAIEAATQLPSGLTLTNVDIGFCPFECRRCFDGGPIKRLSNNKEGPSKHVYDRVPGGDRNCILCRHFVSGPPWAVQLELYGTKLCEQRQHLALEELRIQDEQEKLEQAWRDGKIGKNRYRQMYDERDSAMIKTKEEQIIVENAIFNVELLLLACIELMPKKPGKAKMPMIAGGGESIVNYVETSKFEHSLLQTAASRIHHILDDPRVQEVRDRYIDVMLFDAGIRPPRLMVQLTDEQRAAAMDSYADLLRRRTTEADRKALIDGEVGLESLPIWEEVKTLMTSALKGSINLPDDETAAGDRSKTLVLEVLK